MSEDGDVDVESAEDVPDIGVEATATTINSNGGIYRGQDKRAHHNALERRRRDHIKDSFHGLRDCIPSLVGEKVSRAHILNKATEYIRHMQKGGSSREDDICELAKKNEILEEQVRALEEARACGGSFSAEDLLQSVAARVQARQAQEMIQQLQAKNSAKSSKQSKGKPSPSSATPTTNTTSATSTLATPPNSTPRVKPANKTTTNATPAATTKDPSPPGSTQQPLPNINLLTSNIKNTQTLLSVLQKNLTPNSNLPPNIKSLAAKVLASPLIRGAQKNSQASPALPRGIVTATTVPKGSNLAPSPSSSSSPTPPLSVSTPPSKPSPSNTGTIGASSHNAVSLKSKLNAAAATIAEEVDHSVKGHSLLKTTSTLQQPPTASSSAAANSPLLTSQLLEAHNLLQQQGGLMGGGPGDVGDVSSLGGGLATQALNISPELLAQVSSLLNLPTAASSLAGSSPTTALPTCDGESSLFTSPDVLSQPLSQATPMPQSHTLSSSHKRPAPLSEPEPQAKKAHIEH